MQHSFAGTLTTRDCKRHIQHRFTLSGDDVGRDGARLEISFRFAPHVVHGMANLLTLTVFDPTGFRGAGHRHGSAHSVSIGVRSATPGYLAGPIQPGEWVIEIDTHMIMPGEPVHYTLDASLAAAAEREPVPAAPAAAPASASAPRGPGWFRGDLHSHTHHSDAGKRSVAELIDAARRHRLDFLFLSDHNTISGLAEMDAASSDVLLTSGGIELTTFWGHALCLGTREWVDWRVRPGTGDMARIAEATYARGQIFIMAHPGAIGDPHCTGCCWRFGDMMPGAARLIEIWNSPWHSDSRNETALALYYDWLNQGLRLVATAGTDTHRPHDYDNGPGFSVIYADALTQEALFRALRAGHLYLSAGPRLKLEAHGPEGERWMMGDVVPTTAAYHLQWSDAPEGARIRVIANGRLMNEQPAPGSSDMRWTMEPDQANWITAELRADNGDMLAITNPIFLA